jgi:hypothetical protein
MSGGKCTRPLDDPSLKQAAEKVVFPRMLKNVQILKFPNPAFGGTEE